MTSWERVLREMTKDFTVIYVETREKVSSVASRKTEYSVEAIGRDIVRLISILNLDANDYILFGSSLGATAILDCCRFLETQPKCLVLIEPNAAFRVPRVWKIVVRLFWPPLYSLIRPSVKWYLRTFRMNVEADRAQYEKYCGSIDAADPWKLKKAVIALWNYEVWDKLEYVQVPALFVGASKDKLHEPESIEKMVSMVDHASYIDLETNTETHNPIMVDEMRKYLKRIQ